VVKKLKRLLLALLLFSSPLLADEYTIYTTQRPPFSWSGVIDSEGYYYDFTNSGIDKCDIVARGCFIKTNVKAEIINKDIIKVQNRYFCSEEHIKARNKANPKLTKLRYSSIDMGYGNCTKDGWVRELKE
tara:strand:- start:234 stop:623 length:390 start_codon:yes stop_codon:yes gene_type:complete